jgi:ribonuclease HI
MSYNLFTDGGARGNPGAAAAGFFLFDEKFILVDFGGKYLGETTNNKAEYSALLEGLKLAKKHEVASVHVFMDSELIVKQLNGSYKVKDAEMKHLFDKVQKAIAEFESVQFTHVLRAKNRFADKMVNIVLDHIQK